MLSIIDKKLFPDYVVLYKLPNGRVAYLIRKNGSTTLRHVAVDTVDPATVELIDVFIRDPYERFLSGVNTFIEYHSLDTETVANIVNQVYFIDNHFCPQLFWIINLKRFTNAKIRINNLDTMYEIVGTRLHDNKKTNNLDKYFCDNKQLKYYLEMDNVLYENYMGQTVDIDTILNTFKLNYSELYSDSVVYSKGILDVLP